MGYSFISTKKCLKLFLMYKISCKLITSRGHKNFERKILSKKDGIKLKKKFKNKQKLDQGFMLEKSYWLEPVPDTLLTEKVCHFVLQNKGPLKILNDTKLIINDPRGHSDFFTINSESFRTFLGELWRTLRIPNWF